MDVEETLLPGVGIRYEFTTRSGVHLGVVARRDGQVTLVTYGGDDPDAATEVAALDRAEAEALAEMLGAPRIVERFADLTREVPGLRSERVEVPPSGRYVDRPLGDTRARTRTGVSVVAVVRGSEVVASPAPGERLRAGDVLVVVGTDDGIAALRRILGEPAG